MSTPASMSEDVNNNQDYIHNNAFNRGVRPMVSDEQMARQSAGRTGDEYRQGPEFQMDNDSNDDYQDLRNAIIKRRSSAFVYRNEIQKLNYANSLLLKLPTEILLQIFHYLERKDLFMLLTVCHEFADLIIEILWFRPNMQIDSSFNKIREVMELPRYKTHWDYRTYIKRLNLSFMTKLVDDKLLYSFVGCPKLERLTLVNCTKLTRHSISAVLQCCDRLQSIDLTGVSDIHDDIILALASHCPRLQGLYAPGCGQVSEGAILKLLRSCPMLKRVKFNGSSNITDEVIKAMYENCKSLVEIDLHNCPNVTDKFLRLIFLHLSQLREFRISNAPGITDGLLDLLPDEFCLEKLRIVDLTSCNAVTDKLVEKLVKCAPRLRNIVLSKCMQISDAALRALSQLGRSLHYIHLGHCALITDFGVASLVRSCHRIQYIDLACCSQLTDWTLVELSSLPKLRRIGLVKCSLISDSGILELVRRRGDHDCLERVHLSYCTNLTIGPIYLLLNNCPKLTHLSLTGIAAFLRREITQYCRDPPPDFNESQKSSFCVFSGQGVAQLRNHLNQMIQGRAYLLEHGDVNPLFQERRRYVHDNNDSEEDELNVWARQRGLGFLQEHPLANHDVSEVSGEVFRELNEGSMGPEEMREHFQRLIRNHHEQRLIQRHIAERREGNQARLHNQNHNIQNAPQLIQPAVFPSRENNPSFAGETEGEDVEMQPVDLFPSNPNA